MDERIPVEQVLGLRLGDAHIFRNAGGLVTDDAIRSAALSVNFFGTREIIVLNHTECGMMSATGGYIVRTLKEKLGVSPSDIPIDPSLPELGKFRDEQVFAKWFRTFESVDEVCEQQVKLLREHPLIPKDVVIHGYIYEVETGRLRRPFQRLHERVNTAKEMGART